MKKLKVGGYVLLETVLAMIAFSMLSMAFFTIFSGQFSMINSSRDALQAQQYAEIDAQKLRLMNYYDLDDEGAKSRSAMTSWENPNGTWEDEITIGNEIVVDDYNQSKQKIASIKIYRKGDTLPRFSMEVPISSQGSGVPIGSIIAWGVDSNPSYDGGTYLECDGSTFDKNKYKRLYDVLGTDKLPNYQGLFLRGYGSQEVADDRKRKIFTGNSTNWNEQKEVSKVTHSSADKVGGIQYDSLRPIFGFTGHNQFAEQADGFDTAYQNGGNFLLNSLANGSPTPGVSSFPMLSAPATPSPKITNDLVDWGTDSDFKDDIDGWYTALTKWKYNFRKHYGTDENGNRFLSDIELVEEEIHPTLRFNKAHFDLVANVESVMPVTNEIRPANVAVKFMIKAK